MDINKYSEKKEKGLLQIMPIGNSFALISKQFDQHTGEEIDPEIITLDREEYVKQRDNLMEKVKSFDELIADIDAVLKND